MNCSRRANSSWVKLDTTAQNHFITCGNRKINRLRYFDQWPAVERKRRQRISMTYFLSEVPRPSDNHSMGLEVLHVYITCAAHQKLKRVKGKQIIITQQCFQDQQDFIVNTTHTSNSFSSNMASRFSGTSSFKPAIDQEITLITCTLPEISNERNWQRKWQTAAVLVSSPFRKCSTSSLTWLASLYWASRLR